MKRITFSIVIKSETLNEGIRKFRDAVKTAVEKDQIIEVFDIKIRDIKERK